MCPPGTADVAVASAGRAGRTLGVAMTVRPLPTSPRRDGPRWLPSRASVERFCRATLPVLVAAWGYDLGRLAAGVVLGDLVGG